ncbi:lipoyl synthase [Bacteroidetes/Chlorobi group bacterium MS-B_bin-24]|jgi:lipoic acid synthetase|nr:MAG: lipoyl synthase [Bacteroidetes/Chlorobi group bacterium MS-B_bin-24]
MHKIDYPERPREQGQKSPRPEWLKVRAPGGETYANLKKMMRSKTLHTVCEEAHCPNIGECWGRGTATFLILGDICTRSCGFCAIKTGRPQPVDPEEPLKVALAVQQMGISHVVITSVNRDELPDQGSTIWAKTIVEVRRLNPKVSIEVLIPDFKGDLNCLQRVLDAKPNILNHNVETVPRLYRTVRPQAKYERSLRVLQYSKEQGFITKTGIMVGIGETFDEVVQVMKDLRQIDVDIFTIGQYLQPTPAHLPVDRFVTPEEFKQYKLIGIELGFRHVESGPLVRSSYHAESHVV